MRLAIRALLIALLPSIAAAQSDAGSGSVTTLQVTSSLGIPGSFEPPTTPASSDSARTPVTGARVLVVDCPATTTSSRGGAFTLANVPADSSGTASLVAALCARATPGTAPALPPRAERRAEAHHEPEADAPAAPAAPFEPHLTVHFFADVKFSATDSVGSKNGFGLGQFDLFTTSQLSDNLSVLTEATLTALPRNTFSPKLERLMVTFSPSNHFAASVGRFHTGIGYYNTAYHHGTWFQTAVGRPLVFAIDGDIGVVPIHTLGVSVGGEIPSGALGLRYLAEVGSGRAGQSSGAIAPQPSLDDNNTPAVNLALVARPDGIDGLQFGVSVYRDRLTLQDTSRAPLNETIAAAHVAYKTDAVELLTEALAFRRTPRGALPASSSRGYYAQLSRRFGTVRPYARMDYLDIPRSDPLLGFLGRRSGPTVGVRYDFDALAALKVQASHLDQTTRPTMNRLDAQVAFMF